MLVLVLVLVVVFACSSEQRPQDNGTKLPAQLPAQLHGGYPVVMVDRSGFMAVYAPLHFLPASVANQTTTIWISTPSLELRASGLAAGWNKPTRGASDVVNVDYHGRFAELARSRRCGPTSLGEPVDPSSCVTTQVDLTIRLGDHTATISIAPPSDDGEVYRVAELLDLAAIESYAQVNQTSR